MRKQLNQTTVFFVLLVFVSFVGTLQVCDQRLLNTFKLKGLKTSITDPMYICPGVKDKCCSLMDEIEIISMWKMNSQYHLRVYREGVTRIYELFMEMHYDFIELGTTDIPMHYLYFRKVPYIRKICFDNTVRLPNDVVYNKEVADKLLPGKGAVKTIPSFPIVNDSLSKEKNDYKNKVMDLIIEYIEAVKKVNEQWEKVEVPCTFKHTWKGKIWQECRKIRHFRELKERGVKHLEFADETKDRRLLQKNAINKYMQAQLVNYKNLKNDKKDTKQMRDLRLFIGVNSIKELKKMKGKKRKLFFGKIKKFFKGVGTAIGDFFTKARRVKAALKRDIKRQFELNELYQQWEVKVSQAKDVLAKSVVFQSFDKALLQSKQFYIPSRREFPFIKCVNKKRKYYHSYLMMNEKKSRYCMSVMDTVKQFKMNDFKAYFPQIRDIMIGLLDLKKTLYCDICDAHRQRYFNGENRMVIYTQEFCRDILGEYRDYFYWKNVLMVEYLDLQMQFIGCMESAGNVYKYPIPTAVTWHKRRIFFIKRCLDNLNSKNFYRYCRFICVQFKYDTYSKFFDGDVEFLGKIFYKISKFIKDGLGRQQITLREIKRDNLRKKKLRLKKLMAKIKLLKKKKSTFGKKKKKSKKSKKRRKSKRKASKKVVKKNVKAKKKKKRKVRRRKRNLFAKKKPKKSQRYRLIKKLGKKIVTTFTILSDIRKMKYYHKPNMKYKDLPIPHGKKISYKETYVTDQIYEKVDKPYDFKCWRAFFTEHKNGLNPLRDSVDTDFDFKLTSLIELQAKRTKREQLNLKVMETYLKTDKTVQNEFNNDLDEMSGEVRTKKSKSNENFGKKKKKKPVNEYEEKDNKMVSGTDWFDEYVGDNSLDKSAKVMHNMLHKVHDY